MSLIASSEFGIKDDGDASVKPLKCKIPQRCVQGRNKFYNKPKKVPNPTSTMNSKADSQMQQSKIGSKNASRTQSDERRPQSATSDVRETSSPVQSVRPVRDFLLPATLGQRNSSAARKGKNETAKTRPMIRVPLMKEPIRARTAGLPEQKKYEKSELHRKACLQSLRTNSSSVLSEVTMLSKLDQNPNHISWEEKKNLFEKLKAELKLRQRAVIELYNSLKKDKNLNLSPSEELLVNTENEHTPQKPYSFVYKDKIKPSKDKSLKVDTTPGLISLDLNKLCNIPVELVNSCENTLVKQRHVIEWLDSYIKNDSKGIDRKEIVTRVREMSKDGETLCDALNNVRDEFSTEIQDIATILRKGVDDMMVLQLRVEELTYKVSELNSQNADLRKQLQKAEHFKSFNNKTKIEELERELKEEKCSKEILRNRYNRSDVQVKSGVERISQLEGMLEQARSQTRTLERTVQHLREENQNLQNKFDSELKKLTESITENSEHLNEIAVTREKLQLEKEELEKRLEELSQYYNESIANMKVEVNANINKVVESDKQYRLILEEKEDLKNKIELLGAQLIEAERINTDLIKESSDKELKLKEFDKQGVELQDSKSKLQKAQEDIKLYGIKLQEQHDILEQSQNKFMEILESVDTLKNTICIKEECIGELESKQTVLEQQLVESDQKMENYERQMATLKNKLSELQQDFGELSDMNKLRFEEEHEAKMLEMENRKDSIITKLTEKENEQFNIIHLLQKNLELRTQVDEDLSNRISAKDSEIESLTRRLESREKEMDKLEKMILALEDKRQKSIQQSKIDKQKINTLENDLSQYKSLSQKHKSNNPEDINNIIEIFESELNLEPNLISGKCNDKLVRQKQGDRKKDKIKNFECHEISSQLYKMDSENAPAKSVKKICVANDSYNDNCCRKKPLSSINTQKWLADISSNLYMNKAQPLKKPLNKPQNYQEGSLPVLIGNHIRNERKYKMFKLAGHQL